MKDDGISAYLPVFNEKLQRIKKVIKSELDKPKKDRSKNQLRKLLAEAKKLQNIVNQFGTKSSTCPHCGGAL